MIQQALERVRAELRAVEASLARAHASLAQVAAAAEASPQTGPDRRKLSRVWSPERDALWRDAAIRIDTEIARALHRAGWRAP